MVERRIKAAKFPATKSLDSFDFKAIPKLTRMQVLELARCEWIDRRENVIALGPLDFVPISKTGAELLFVMISQRYERGATLITSNLPFDECTETFGTKRLTGALLDRLTHHVNILEMNGERYRLTQSRARTAKNNA